MADEITPKEYVEAAGKASDALTQIVVAARELGRFAGPWAGRSVAACAP